MPPLGSLETMKFAVTMPSPSRALAAPEDWSKPRDVLPKPGSTGAKPGIAESKQKSSRNRLFSKGYAGIQILSVTPKPSRIPSPAKRERTGAKRQVRVENAERRALMAAARFVGCPSPSPSAASPRRPLPLRGRGGRRTSQLGSSILFSRPLRADASTWSDACPPAANPLPLPADRRPMPPNPFGGWFAAERGEVNLPQRKRAQAESRRRHHVPAQGDRAAGCCELRRRLHANLAFHPAALAVPSIPYAMRL